MTRYALNPSTPVLFRPDDTIQVGWDPRRAVVVHPPSGLPASVLAELLRALQSTATIPELQVLAAEKNADESAVDGLVTHLVESGVVTAVQGRRTHAASIRIHGRGPLSDLLTTSLRCSGARISHTSRTHASTGAADLAVLTDYLVADPRVVRELHDAGVPHLPVRVRDGTGLVGPLVIPGLTSCLRCADLHRSDRDAAWPAIAAQLIHTVGTAPRATVLATAALALNKVDRVIRAVRADCDPDIPSGSPTPPSTIDTTLEYDVGNGSIAARRWSRHPKCMC